MVGHEEGFEKIVWRDAFVVSLWLDIKVRRFRGKFVVVLSKDSHLSNRLINLGRDLMNNYAIRLFPWD